MARSAPSIALDPEERSILIAWSKSRSIAYRLVIRSRIILMASDGLQSQQISEILGLSRPTIQLWRERFLSLRLKGLAKDATRPGRKPKLTKEIALKVVDATLNSIPPNTARWTTRAMASAQGISEASVRRIWRTYGIKPHLALNSGPCKNDEITQNFDPTPTPAPPRDKKRNVRRNPTGPDLTADPTPRQTDTLGLMERATAKKQIGLAVKGMRQERGMTKKDFAKLCKISLKALTTVEDGSYQIRHLIAVADGLQIPIPELNIRTFKKPS